MEMLLKLSRGIREIEGLMDIEVMADKDFSLTLMKKERQVLLFVVFALLFTVLSYKYAKRKTKLQLNGNIESIQPDRLRLTGINAAGANIGNEPSFFISQQNHLEIEANRANDHHEADQKYVFKAKFGKRIAVINFILELPSAVFDQLSSAKKPHYVLTVMLISFASLFVCFVEIVYRGKRERVTWKWGARIPWFYYPPPETDKPLGTLMDIIGMVCAISQCIVTTINYSFFCRHVDGPIRLSVWPIIFAFGLLCSKFCGEPKEESGRGESRAVHDEGNGNLHQAVVVPLVP